MKLSASEFAWGHSGVLLWCFTPISAMYDSNSLHVKGGPLSLRMTTGVLCVEKIIQKVRHLLWVQSIWFYQSRPSLCHWSTTLCLSKCLCVLIFPLKSRIFLSKLSKRFGYITEVRNKFGDHTQETCHFPDWRGRSCIVYCFDVCRVWWDTINFAEKTSPKKVSESFVEFTLLWRDGESRVSKSLYDCM